MTNQKIRPQLPKNDAKVDVAQQRTPLSVGLGLNSDRRQSSDVGIVGGERLMLDGDALYFLSLALEEELRAFGIKRASVGSNKLALHLEEWKVESLQGFPTDQLTARATVLLELHDAEGTLLISGRYQGAHQLRSPVVTSGDIEKALGLSLVHVVERVVGDNKFLALIRE